MFVQFRLFCIIYVFSFPHLYFEPDAFTQHALHVLNAPDGNHNYHFHHD